MSTRRIYHLLGRIFYFSLGFAACFFIFPLEKNRFEKSEEAFMAGLNYMHGCYWAAARLPNAQKNHDQWLAKCLSMSHQIQENNQEISSQIDQIESNKEKK